MQQNTPEQGPETTSANLGQAAPASWPYTSDEWKILLETPMTVCRAIMAVSPSGVVGTSQEVIALRSSLSEALQQASSPLLQSLRQQLQSQGKAQALWRDIQDSLKDRPDAASVRQAALIACQRCVSLLHNAPAQDGLAYREFVYAAARRVAEAAKEGGMQGFGGQAITDAEQALLKDLSNALGLPGA